MKTSQDNVPTHRLGERLALDNQGRVLRKPHFLTRPEHEAIVDEKERAWSGVLMAERAKVQEAEAKYRELDQQYSLVLFSKTTSIEIVDPPKIFARRRLHWMVRWLVRVDRP